MNLVVRTQEELRDVVEGIVRGISDGLAAARADQGVHVEAPDDLLIEGIFLLTLDAAVQEESTLTPASETTTTDANGETTVTETIVPSDRTTTRAESGGDTSSTENTYDG